MRFTILGAAALVGSISSYPMLASGPAPTQDRYSRTAPDYTWHGHVPQGSTFEIKGINGSVTAEPGAGSEVEVVATRKGRRSNPEDVRIEVVEHGGGTTVCAVYPSPRENQPNECRPGRDGRMNTQNNDVVVTFKVRVPAGVRFAGRTVNGDVEVASLNGPVAVATVNGSITFSTASYGE